MQIIKHNHVYGFESWEKGGAPKLLIHTGTHGDEFEVIELVKDCLVSLGNKLPDYIFIPFVSPSAVATKTRQNKAGLDINRVFFSDSTESEVLINIQVIENCRFDLFVAFHEDPDCREYYIYDTDFIVKENDLVKRHNHFLKGKGVGLLNGLDDPEDPSLGYEFINGYLKFKHKKSSPDNGMANVWALNHGVAKETLIPEIPGKLNLKMKKLIVDSFFRKVLIPYFNQERRKA